MQDKRRYIRLNSCFPVEFSLYFIPRQPISEEYQGFTSNVSESGLCVSVHNLKEQDRDFIMNKRARLNLSISMPLSSKPVCATADIIWCRKEKEDSKKKTYLIGLSYKDIDEKDRKRIVNYALRLRWMPRVAVSILIALFIGYLGLFIYNLGIKKTNQRLVGRFVSISDAKTDLERRLNEAKVRSKMLEDKLMQADDHIERIKRAVMDTETKGGYEKERLNKEIQESTLKLEDFDSRLAGFSGDKTVKADMARNIIEKRKDELERKKEALQIELDEIEKKSRISTEGADNDIRRLKQENEALKKEIELVKQGEISLEKKLGEAKSESCALEEASTEKMIDWIRIHQVKKTGLVLSYEGDDSLKDYGFSYDQSLACQVFLISGDTKKAQAILDFYKDTAKRSKDLFYNAYDVRTGEPCEYEIHSGPNIWIGISACQYTKLTGDKRYLSLATGIANSIIKMQLDSDDGSIRGGPDIKWTSTEHNLDAYAFFNMLYDLTLKRNYKDAATASLEWLKAVGYNRPEGGFLRGKGDSTIATDTFSWAIAAVKPMTLLAYGMNPDGIMEFAENECKIETTFCRPEGTDVKIVGFDFSKAQNIGRGGIISTEWTAQMVVALDIMADYYKTLGNIQKEKIYRTKAAYYLSQLGKMVISSPSPTGQGEGCLPYASIDNVDTGHGWRVAKGRRTGSVAATAYYIFASKKHNPLSF